MDINPGTDTLPLLPLSGPVRLALVEDDTRLRTLLYQYLSHQPEFTCVAAVASVEELLVELEEVSLPPQILLLDINLPGMSGLEALPMLKKRLPATDIIIQTMHDDADRIYQALRAGASGYIVKNLTPLADYKQAVLDVARGGAAIGPSVARKMLAHFTPAPSKAPDLLSERERQVLEALVDGLSEKMVAARLGLSPDTVHTYVRRLYEKLQVRSRGELLGKAARGTL